MTRLGMTTIPPRSSTQWTNLSLSYPLSTKTACLSGQTILAAPGPYRRHYGFRWRAKNAMNYQAHSLPHGLSLSNLLGSVRFLRGIPFFSPTGMLVNFHCSAVQHQCCLVTRSCSIRAERTRSHTPAFVHVRNRLYTLCHGPKRSGRSRHGIPVFNQYRIASNISRLLFPGRPPCGFLSGGNKNLILFLCFSLISCRFISPIISVRHLAHNISVLKQTLGLGLFPEIQWFFVKADAAASGTVL